MKGITELSSLLPDLFIAQNVAEETFRLGDRHAGLEATCCLLSGECEPFLSPPFSFQVSIRVCRLRDIAYDMSSHCERFLKETGSCATW